MPMKCAPSQAAALAASYVEAVDDVATRVRERLDRVQGELSMRVAAAHAAPAHTRILAWG